jgi:hypothetical protein
VLNFPSHGACCLEGAASGKVIGTGRLRFFLSPLVSAKACHNAKRELWHGTCCHMLEPRAPRGDVTRQGVVLTVVDCQQIPQTPPFLLLLSLPPPCLRVTQPRVALRCVSSVYFEGHRAKPLAGLDQRAPKRVAHSTRTPGPEPSCSPPGPGHP